MDRFLIRTIVLLIAMTLPFLVVYGFLLFASSEPSTSELDADLRAIATNLQELEVDRAQYTGAIVSILEVRRQILLATRDMLQQKRTSVLRRITLDYRIGGAPVAPKPDRLAALDAEIKAGLAQAAADDADASRYAGGLLQSVGLIKAATERLGVDQLRLAYLAEKYGIPFSIFAAPMQSAAPRNVVADGDAL